MKKNILISSLLAAMLVLIIGTSCDFDKTTDPDINTEPDCTNLSDVSFATDVLPILTANCATSGCHDAITVKKGYNYGLYADAKKTVDNNLMIGVINHESGFSAMPTTYKMEDCDINKITAWVNEGALDN
ncbi:MAG: hypothetical protein ACPGXZ_01260 [Saprospiraceae bacterium]